MKRTSEHCLIFDYTGPIENGALAGGKLSPEVLCGATPLELPTTVGVAEAPGAFFHYDQGCD